MLLSQSFRDSSKDPLLYARRWKMHEKYLIDSGFKGSKREALTVIMLTALETAEKQPPETQMPGTQIQLPTTATETHTPLLSQKEKYVRYNMPHSIKNCPIWQRLLIRITSVPALRPLKNFWISWVHLPVFL